MEQKTLQAQTQATTDLGEFEAIAAAWTPDREKDVIHRGAFAGTIRQWRRSGKRLPLHWDHKGDPDKIIGHIDPLSMQERPDGLYVKGQVDLEGSQLGREAWRLIKSGVVGLSFGYLPTQAKARSGGGRDLHELDMFEVSITPAPMHPDTRILSTKGLTVDELVDTAREHPGVVEAVVESVKDGRSVEAREQRKRAEALEFEEIAGKAAKVSDTPHAEPFSSSTTSNWVARHGGLPHYIQNIAHDLLEKGRAADESKAIEMAIGIVKNWAEGKGNVSAETRAKAAAAVAEWEKMKAEAHAKPGKSVEVEMAPEELLEKLEGSHAKAASVAIAEWEQKKRAELEAEHEKATLRRRADAVELEEVAGDDLKPDEKAVPEKPAPQVGVSLEEIAALVEEAQAKAVEVAQAKWEEMRAAELEAEQKKTELRRQADAVEFQEVVGDAEAKAKQSGGGGEVRMLQSMIAQGKEYVAREPDNNDKAVMNEILDLLTKLAGMEESDQQAEGEKKLAPVKKGDEKPAKSRRDRDGADDADVTGEYRRVDPLRRQADAIALEFFSDGESLRKSPPVKHVPKPEPELSLKELQERMRDEMLIALTGGDESLLE
jgi:HK97 family phage prohead protease